MMTLLANEWTKLRRERAIWFALVLHLAPLAMVIAAAVMGAQDGSPANRYFVLHNQSMIVTGIVSVVVTSAAFHVELANRTWFEWLMLPVGRLRLLIAKMTIVFAIQTAFVALSAGGSAAFLLACGAGGELPRLILAYLVLQLGTMTVVSTAGGLLCLLVRNVLIVNVIGVAGTMVTMVVMAADFSWAIPTAWAYRAGLAVLDPSEYGFGHQWELPVGGAVFLVCSLLAASLSGLAIRSSRAVDPIG